MIPNIEGRLTPIGTLTSEICENGHVTVRFRPREGVSLRHSAFKDGDAYAMDFWQGKRPPKLHEEVSIEGTTIEVVGVAQDPDGTVWVTGDNGARYKWE